MIMIIAWSEHCSWFINDHLITSRIIIYLFVWSKLAIANHCFIFPCTSSLHCIAYACCLSATMPPTPSTLQKQKPSHSSAIKLLVVLLSIISVVAQARSSYKPNDDGNKPCEPNGGNCSYGSCNCRAPRKPLRSRGPAFYGKYCGGLNKCYTRNGEDFITKGTKGKRNLGLENVGLLVMILVMMLMLVARKMTRNLDLAFNKLFTSSRITIGNVFINKYCFIIG